MVAPSPEPRRASRFEQARSVIKVTAPTRRRLDVIRGALEDSKDREVTWSEVLDHLAEAWDRWQALADLAKQGKDQL
jgi:hypothetical protein